MRRLWFIAAAALGAAPVLCSAPGAHGLGTNDINIVIAADGVFWRGVFAAMHSVALNSRRPGRVHIFPIVYSVEKALFERQLACMNASNWGLGGIHAVGIPRNKYWRPDSKVLKGRLDRPLNFIRFYMHRILPPSVRKVLYMDADVLVRGDIQEVWDYMPTEAGNWLCGASHSSSMGAKFGKAQAAFEERYHRSINLTAPSFNAGICFFNLRRWVELGVDAEVVYWLGRMREKIYFKGSQSPLVLSVHGVADRCLPLPSGWHVITSMSQAWTPHDKLVHWAGKYKPWKSTGMTGHTWKCYEPSVCTGQGACGTNHGVPVCLCRAGFNGSFCEVDVRPRKGFLARLSDVGGLLRRVVDWMSAGRGGEGEKGVCEAQMRGY